MDFSKNRKIITTKDGSHSLSVPSLNEQYHSIHGAKQEAEHVFLKMGLEDYAIQEDKKDVSLSIFEVGFGTGLNALLTANWAKKNNKNIDYTAIEKHPVSKEEHEQLNYGDLLGEVGLYNQISKAKWNVFEPINDFFKVKKMEIDLIATELPKGFDVIYFDAFAPNKQPQLWEVSVFKKMYDIMNRNALLVTYRCQGQARRNMIESGLKVEKVPGPPGKREMLRARKL
jgi:tRNA U34 5-methylaminomethyl-2-thiouridine-forming methyltransferase MnmC